jgi:hypothetical protein
MLFYDVADLLGLLKWKAQPENVLDNISKLMKVDEKEIVKVSHFISAIKHFLVYTQLLSHVIWLNIVVFVG